MLLDASRHNNGVQFLGIGTPKCGPNLMCFAHFHLEMCFSSQQSAIFGHRHVKKCFGTLNFFSILTSKCASRHSGVQFFDIGTSKSGPTLTCFPHFHLKMSFWPQRRAIFGHRNRNFKKRYEADVFCAFLRAILGHRNHESLKKRSNSRLL